MAVRAALILSSSLALLPAVSHAAGGETNSRLDGLEEKLAQQQRALDAQAKEIAALRQHTGVGDPFSFKGGHPQFRSADGQFTLQLKSLVQLDAADYMQSKANAALGPDLSSGFNVRRARLGIKGKLFGDWSYYVNYEFGGSGTESGGRLQAGYIEYDGFGPVALRAGAYPPPAGLEDTSSVATSLFLERTAPAEVARGFAGGDGRDAVTAFYRTKRVFAALSYTGGKVGDSKVWYDEQSALLGDAALLALDTPALQVLVDVNGTDVFQPARSTPGANPTQPVSLSAWPELTVDDTATKFVNTGALNAKDVRQWGAETGFAWRQLYGQGGYFGYHVARIGAAGVAFDGWYGELSYVLMGGPRRYNDKTGSFSGPKPSGRFGALEIAARYSDLNLNDMAGTAGAAMPAGGVRGGEQKIWSVGLNWNPNTLVRFMLNYQSADESRLNAAGMQIGQRFQMLSFRTQFAL